ncbi:MAG: TonB-dependent receptor plug domain-containing protein [Thermodesulfovibrionales bacterium]
MKIRIYLILLFLFLSSTSTAEEISFSAGKNLLDSDHVRFEDVVVTASRIEEPLEETASSVVIIRGEEINKRNFVFVTDLFRELPELNLVQNGGPGKNATVFLRGGGPEHVLVMIDGIKVNSTTTGSFDFSGLSVDDIDRIEIVKGPQSTIYGSEAMAGVINIITKKGTGRPHLDLSIEGGSFGTYKPTLTLSGGDGKVDYRLTASHYYSDGISAAKEGTERDSYKNSSISGRFGFKPSERFRFELSGRYYYDRTDLDGFDFIGKKAIDDLNFVSSGNHYILSGKITALPIDRWEQVLTVSRVRDSLRFRDPDDPFNNAGIITLRDTVDWQNNLYLNDYYTLTAGLEFREEKGDNRDNFAESINNKAFYLNNKFSLFKEQLILNAGLRYDDHERAGSKVTYRVGGLYNLKDLDMRIRGSFGTGFRAPSFNELFFPFYGNLNLEPEETRSWEVGLEKEMLKGDLILTITYFDQRYKDLIQTDPNTWTASNIAKAEVKGVETALRIKLSEVLYLSGGYTYLDSEDKETGEPLTRRPKDKFNTSIAYSRKDLSMLVDFIFIGRRFDSSIKRTLSSYSVTNISVSYKLTKDIIIFSRIENLFDTDYEEAGTYGTPGFSAYGGIRLSI